MQQNATCQFSKTRIGFVLASVGSAVGIGQHLRCSLTAWARTAARRLPADLFFGFVALSGWGRAFSRPNWPSAVLTGTGPISAPYAYALRQPRQKRRRRAGAPSLRWVQLGIAIGYAVIVGWAVRCCWGAVSGSLFAVGNREEIFRADHRAVRRPAVARGVVVLVAVLVLARGVLQGE